MGNVSPIKYNLPFNMRVDQAFLDALDRLRMGHNPPLSRADFVRKLVIEARRREDKRK